MNKCKQGSRLFITPEGFPFIGIAIAFCAIAAYVGSTIVLALMIMLTLFVVWFFRNPERSTDPDQKAVISPADGTVIKIEEMKEDVHLNRMVKKISIFMSVFNVHVNRIPVSGIVRKIAYYPGKFLVASLDKASEANERNAVVVEMPSGVSVMFVQIAGLVARRIVCYLREGDSVEKGCRFGLIRFGSRVDVYLPMETTISVKVGDKVKAGETVLGRLGNG